MCLIIPLEEAMDRDRVPASTHVSSSQLPLSSCNQAFLRETINLVLCSPGPATVVS